MNATWAELLNEAFTIVIPGLSAVIQMNAPQAADEHKVAAIGAGVLTAIPEIEALTKSDASGAQKVQNYSAAAVQVLSIIASLVAAVRAPAAPAPSDASTVVRALGAA